MSITDELREYASNNDIMHYHHEYIAIANRIDAEHERAVTAAHSNGITEYGSMVAREYVKLPVDADGVPIRIGDVMAYADNTKPMEVVALVPPAVFLTEDGPRYADMCRHYHKPTVEDVLREFADRVCNSGHQWGLDAADTIAEYAAKLQLREDA